MLGLYVQNEESLPADLSSYYHAFNDHESHWPCRKMWFEGVPKDFLLCIGYLKLFNTLHTLSPPRGSADDVVYTQQELGSLAGTAHNSVLKLVSLNNTQLAHICDTATGGQQVKT
jgi:hypothetical protein